MKVGKEDRKGNSNTPRKPGRSDSVVSGYGSKRGSVFRAPFPVPCCVCRKPTAFIDLDYEAAFCSGDGLRVFETRLTKRGDSGANQT